MFWADSVKFDLPRERSNLDLVLAYFDSQSAIEVEVFLVLRLVKIKKLN